MPSTHKQLPSPIFVTGIGTDVGKTVASAIIVKALSADYWKPIQAGDLDNTDSMKVQSWVKPNTVHPEAYRLNLPASPHHAAAQDGVDIRFHAAQLPKTNNTLIMEGAGGLMVPINQDEVLIDAISVFTKTCIVVSKHYLGSINHTLLTLEVLKQKGFEVLGVIFNGPKNQASEDIILRMSGVKNLGRIAWATRIDQTFIDQQAQQLKQSLADVFN